MGNTKSSAASTSDDAVKADQVSANSAGAVRRRRIDIQMVQNVLLIWLDKNIDNNSADCRNTTTQLRRAVNTINTYTDDEDCIKFLKSMDNDKACMIISGSLGQHIVPRVHNMHQVDSIFIFCSNKNLHESWVKKWPKIKAVFTEITTICEELKKAAQHCEQNSISISFMATRGDVSKKNLNQLDPSFMYTQILKEILLTIKFEKEHFTEFIEYCRAAFAKNESELNNVKNFERNYRSHTPIWWYTYKCFLYPMLNRALRIMDVDTIIQMGFFVGDLHRQIEQLYKEQFNGQNFGKSFIVYRGQGISNSEFERMAKTKGGLISFNNFLSTSRNRKIALDFARDAGKNPDLVEILFVMTIDPTQSTTPFASVNDASYFKGENEVLFSMHTIFRICDIQPIDENHRLFQVDLILTNSNDKDLRRLTDRIREETFPDEEGWYRLGLVLFKMGQFDKAEQVYEILREQTTDEREISSIYNQLGRIKHCQGEYKEAIEFYEKSLEINQKTLHSNHPNLAMTYNNIGIVYYNMSEYSKALSSHEKALAIQLQSLSSDHPDLGMSYNNIGIMYDSMGVYSKALSYYQKDLEISQKTLPPNHPDLAKSYGDIGGVYDNMGEYSKALSSYKTTLEIQLQSLPSNHPDLAISYDNIAVVYRKIGLYSEALSSHEKVLEIKKQSLPSNHPDLGSSYNNIGAVYYNMGEYSKARSFYERAVDIGQQSLPSNHPRLQLWKKHLDRVKKKF